MLCVPFIGTLLYVTLATDGLPSPRPAPADTWPGKRWRSVRSVARAGESLVRGAEVPRDIDPWGDLPESHEPVHPNDTWDRNPRG